MPVQVGTRPLSVHVHVFVKGREPCESLLSGSHKGQRGTCSEDISCEHFRHQDFLPRATA